MAERCPWTERAINGGDELDADVRQHVEGCTDCAAELEIHDQLVAAFRGIARPALSPHFRPQLMVQVARERPRKKIARRRLAILRAYWLAASVVCAAVLANLTWTSSDAMTQTPVLVAIGVFVVPIALLLIAIRTNPFELILQTLSGTNE